MPRPKKATVDYFPHFVMSGKTMFTLEAKYGNDGYAFWFKMLEILGMSEQHFIDCENPTEWEFLLAKTRLSGEIVNSILELLAKLDAIDGDLWQDRIIRSRNFIENLSTLYNKRAVNVISNPEVRDLCIQKRLKSGITANIYPQRRGEESKGENNNNMAHGENLQEEETPTAAAAPMAQPLPGGDLQIQIKPRKATNAKPKADQTKAVALQENTELYTMIKKSFESVFGDFANYAKEGMAIKGIIKLGKADPRAIRTMIETFYSLTRSNSNFWSTKPFTPSSLLAMWDHIKAVAQKDQERTDVSWIEELEQREEVQ